jgi:dipeptidyl aminopeptidase/acylaminoacyl peptidase
MKKLILAAFGAALLAHAPAAYARPMTATDLATMKRLGAPHVSPDGNWAVFQLRETDLEANRGRIDLWLLDLRARGAQPARIASQPETNEHDPRFSADGSHLYYLSNAGGSDQLWRVTLPGGIPEQVTHFETGISGYSLAPGGDRLAVWADRNVRCANFNCTNVPNREMRGSGRVYDELFVRHWDTWRTPGERQRIFVFPMTDGRPTGAGIPVMGSIEGDAPTRPFGGGEEIAWSPDGRTLYFTVRQGDGNEALSTNLDIFSAPADGSRPPVNLTAANRATDTLPAVSRDGRWLAYAAMRHPGYEADRMVLHLRNLSTGETRALTQNWDRSVGSIEWSRDGRSLIVTAQDVLDHPAYLVDVASGRVTRLTREGNVNNVIALPRGGMLFTMNSIEVPDDLYRMDARGAVRKLTAVNADVLAQLDPVTVQRFRFLGAGGAPVWGQILKSANATGRLPVAFLIHGGPQGSFGNAWSWRWNPRTFAAPGYATVSVDFHGSTGYGQAFTDAINRDWGGKPLQDLQLGLAAAGETDPGIDVNNACALGGSYGGYMVNWIAGRWPDGFRCLVNHAGVFDLRAMSYETEEFFFTEWEFGGPYFDPAAAEVMERWNPVHHVQNWRTPMLVIHGERDFRVPYTQGIASFQALQRRGVPSRLVMYPDENHWILKPQNSIQWYREVHGWLDQWLRQEGSPQAR